MTSSYLIDPESTLGSVHYTTSNLERQLDFYIKGLGLKLHWRADRQAEAWNWQRRLIDYE